MKNSYQKKIDCSICGSLKLEKLINLKKFPITGIFVKKKIKQNFPYFFNQSLNICKSCGHIQLENFVDPELLYNNFYSTRTSENHLSKNGINFFKKFVFDVTKKKKLGNFMEIGCPKSLNDNCMESKPSKISHRCELFESNSRYRSKQRHGL